MSSEKLEWSLFLILGLFGLASSAVLHMEVEAIIAPLVFLFAGALLIAVVSGLNKVYLECYVKAFSAVSFFVGVAAFYEILGGDSGGNDFFFYTLTKNGVSGLSEVPALMVAESAVALLSWAFIYDFFKMLGMAPTYQVGVALCSLLMCLSLILVVDGLRLMYGKSTWRLRSSLILFCVCGNIIMFATLHLRDAFIFFFVAIQIHGWLRFFSRTKSPFALIELLVVSLICTFALGALRFEFLFVSPAMAASGLLALILTGNISSRKKWTWFLVGAISLLALAMLGMFNLFWNDLLQAYTTYTSLSGKVAESSSMGQSLIVDQNPIIRIIFGSLYIFLFPIPFWSGLQLESYYHLLKSLNVIYVYFVLPALVISIKEARKASPNIKRSLYFCVFVLIGFTGAIALTSLETRHHAAFYPALVIVALHADLKTRKLFLEYLRYLTALIAAVFGGHLLWVVLKKGLEPAGMFLLLVVAVNACLYFLQKKGGRLETTK